jgi:S1-C subfamily serine protease
MPVHLICPACQAALTVEEKYRGRKIVCTECSRPLLVPRPSNPEPNERDDDEDAFERERPRRKRRRREREEAAPSGLSPLVWVAIGIGSLLVLGVAAGAVVLIVNANSSDKKDQAKRPAAVMPNAGIAMNPGPVQIPLPGLDELVQDLPRAAEEPLQIDVPPPAPDKDDRPKEPLPPHITPEAVNRVKQSTVYMKVDMGDGGSGEGSGFFAMAPGIVMTNAHVVGMLRPESPAPKHIEVVIHSGEAGERSMTGTVVSVDRSSDLAVVRVPDAPDLPPPLPVQNARHVSEVQKVYIYGFPFGAQLGKNITVSESSISSIRRDRFGTITKIQVNGGMHPGNSGGPVVDARGHVVGVSVSVILGTQINFAIPGDFVKVVVHGRVLSSKVDYPYQESGKVRMTYELKMLDPLKKVKSARVEYWYGAPGPMRPPASSRPGPKPGDGPHQLTDLKYEGGQGKGVLILPLPGPGQVLFTRPVFVNGAGETIWVAASPQRFQAPVERKAASLTLKNKAARRRLILSCDERLKRISRGREDRVTVLLKAHFDENVQPKDNASAVHLEYKSARALLYRNGRLDRSYDLTSGASVIHGVGSDFDVDPAGTPSRPRLIFPDRFDRALQHSASSFHDKIADLYELVALPLPNRQLKPNETWQVQRPISVLTEGWGERGRLALTFTFEGTRQRAGREEAVIHITGEVSGPAGQNLRGKATGQAVFDLASGQLIHAKIDTSVDMSVKVFGGEEVKAFGNLVAELSRNLATAPENPREVYRFQGQLSKTDPRDEVRPGYRKTYNVRLKAGKTYVIEMRSDDASGLLRRFDPYLRLEDARGDQLEEDDDSGGELNALIVFRAAADGEYKIIATTFDSSQTGKFTLTVKEG